MEKRKVIIVGAGSAGMSCALKLSEANADFLIITDSLGGRIRYSETEKVNFGAYFIMKNYHNAKKLVIRETWINPLSVLLNHSENYYFPTSTQRQDPEYERAVGEIYPDHATVHGSLRKIQEEL